MGSITLSELLANAADNDHIGKMKVLAVLEALPGVGKVKARRTMDDIGIADPLRGEADRLKAEIQRALLATTDGDPSVRRAAETALIRTRTHKRPVASPRPTP